MTNGTSGGPGHSIANLLSYARTMEREAARRYRQFAEAMDRHDNALVAEAFRRIADLEWVHAFHINELCRTAGMRDVPCALPGDVIAGGEIPDSLEAPCPANPHQAIALARKYEERSAWVYRELAEKAEDQEIRKMALCFAGEEEAHMLELECWLARYPAPDHLEDDATLAVPWK